MILIKNKLLCHVYFEVIGVIAIICEKISNIEFEKAALRSLPWPTGGTKISQQK